MRHQAIYNLYPTASAILEDFTTLDSSGNPIVVDTVLVDAEEAALRFNQSKTDKLNQIDKAYETALDIDIPYMGTTFQANKYSRDLIVSVLSAGSLPAGFFWLDTLNNQVPMIFTELQGLSSAIVNRNQLEFVHRLSLKSQANLATTQVQLDGIIW